MTLTGRPMLRLAGGFSTANCTTVACCCRAWLKPWKASFSGGRRGADRGGAAERGGIDLAIDQRLDPESLRIDDLEQHVLRLHHLPGDHARRWR